MDHRLSLDRIALARRLVDPIFRDSPQWATASLSAELGLRLVVKDETRNPIGCFKGRGASFFAASVDPAQAARAWIAASAGNFGQALAWVAREHGTTLTVYAACGANPLKVERMRGFGATVVLHGDDFDAAKAEAERVAARTGARFVVDGLEPAISEGAGTIGLELDRWPEDLDVVVLPLGNGALVAGVARWLKARRPATRIVAVAAEGASAMVDSLRAGRVVVHDRVDTIADGIAVRVPIPEALVDLGGLVDEAVLVDDATILAAMRLAYEHLGTPLEPAGAAGLAGVLARVGEWRNRTVATVLCGANLTDEQRRSWLG